MSQGSESTKAKMAGSSPNAIFSCPSDTYRTAGQRIVRKFMLTNLITVTSPPKIGLAKVRESKRAGKDAFRGNGDDIHWTRLFPSCVGPIWKPARERRSRKSVRSSISRSRPITAGDRKYGGMQSEMVKQWRALEKENARLKKLGGNRQSARSKSESFS